MVEFYGPLTNWEREHAGKGGIKRIRKLRLRSSLPSEGWAFVIEGQVLSALDRKNPNCPNYNRKVPSATKIGLTSDWQALHLWGPGFGDEAAAGMSYGHSSINLSWQARVEGLLRRIEKAIAGGREIKLRASVTMWDLAYLWKTAQWRPRVFHPDELKMGEAYVLRTVEYRVSGDGIWDVIGLHIAKPFLPPTSPKVIYDTADTLFLESGGPD